MHTIMRFYRIPLRIIITIAILVVLLGQPGMVTGRSGSASERAPSQGNLIPAVVYVTNDYHIHELALKGTWQDRDLTAAAHAPIVSLHDGKPMAFQRSDGVSMVIYQAGDYHIHSLYLELQWQGHAWQEVWHHTDLSDIAGALDATSPPFGYVRSDGINAVVYVSADGHIHELRLESSWIHADLTDISGAPKAWSDERPFAYDRGDGVNAIVYSSNPSDNIIELRLDNGWVWSNLTDISIPNAPNPAFELTAYVRSDGIPTINYRGYDRHIHDLRLETAWYYYDLTGATGAPDVYYNPYGYARSDGINAVVFTAGAYPDVHIYEIYLDNTSWHYYELTSVPNAALGFGPKGYVRADGVNAVVYRGIDDDIHEIRLERDGWHWADLSYLAGAPRSLYANLWPYNRSAVGSTYLPLIVR